MVWLRTELTEVWVEEDMRKKERFRATKKRKSFGYVSSKL